MSLLARIVDGDEIGWQEFYDMYKPLILLRGMDRGLTEEERSDLVQNVMLNVFKSEMAIKFNPQRGGFRTYLKTIIDRRAYDIMRKRRTDQNDMQSLDDEAAFLVSGDYDKLERHWDTAWRKHLLQQALPEMKKQVNEATYRAFEMIVLEGQDPKRVAKTLGVSKASAYMAKHRVLARLRSHLDSMEDDQ
jgi:RNA polymerase sigma-70 factor (ECF subfamily)